MGCSRLSVLWMDTINHDGLPSLGLTMRTAIDSVAVRIQKRTHTFILTKKCGRLLIAYNYDHTDK